MEVVHEAYREGGRLKGWKVGRLRGSSAVTAGLEPDLSSAGKLGRRNGEC
jgi:hypothetical protein